MAALCAVCTASMAQVNVQVHYDFGRLMHKETEDGRANVTTTVELFKADKLGNTFFFVDFDYFSNGVAGAYWEVSREFTFAKPAASNTFDAHIEYDGGLSISKDGGFSSRFQPALLLGPTWNWHNADFSTTVSVQALYKQYFRQTLVTGKTPAVSTFQLTGVWSTTFAKGRLTFAGFVDLWYGFIPEWNDAGQKKGLVFLTEPQLWYNIFPSFAVGTEWEISKNFIYTSNGKNPVLVNPTGALKYKF